MKESLVPIFFGGRFEDDKKKEVEEEKKDGDDIEKEIKQDLGFNYINVVCGSS